MHCVVSRLRELDMPFMKKWDDKQLLLHLQGMSVCGSLMKHSLRLSSPQPFPDINIELGALPTEVNLDEMRSKCLQVVSLLLCLSMSMCPYECMHDIAECWVLVLLSYCTKHTSSAVSTDT